RVDASFRRKDRKSRLAGRAVGAERMASVDPVKKKGVDAVFQDRLSRVAQDTEVLLDRLLGSRPIDGELARPMLLLEAMRYASLGGGKRLRPLLAVESVTRFAGSRPWSAPVCGAV